MDTENYIRTDNPDGSLTFTPIKVSKRFVPKEGEGFYAITTDGEVDQLYQGDHDTFRKGCLSMGNVYRTKEEADKARDKQRALVRIQNYIADNDLGKELVYGESNFSIFYSHKQKVFDWVITSFDEYSPLGHFKSGKACTQVIENCKEDLLIVWGRK